MIETLVLRVAYQKAEFDRLRPLPVDALVQLQKHFDVELTYTSNAIDVITLTLPPE